MNYGGSTGYGRLYRERLRRQWGVVDVEDATAAARSLAEAGEADPARLAIRGGSAGRLDRAGRGHHGRCADGSRVQRGHLLLRRGRPDAGSPSTRTTSSRATWTG